MVLKFRLLHEFLSKYSSKKNELTVTYLLSDKDNSEDLLGDNVTLRRLSIVDENDLDTVKQMHANSNHQIYSINLKSSDNNCSLNWEQFILEPKQENFDKLQKYIYII